MGRKRTAGVPGKPGSIITWSSPCTLVLYSTCWFPPPSPHRRNRDVRRDNPGEVLEAAQAPFEKGGTGRYRFPPEPIHGRCLQFPWRKCPVPGTPNEGSVRRHHTKLSSTVAGSRPFNGLSSSRVKSWTNTCGSIGLLYHPLMPAGPDSTGNSSKECPVTAKIFSLAKAGS